MANVNPMKAVIFGPLGAGKGIQCKKLQRRRGIPHVETGTILRENAEMETPQGTPREYMNQGDYVPDPVINAIVERTITDMESFVLDGYPRTLSQVEFLSSLTDLSVMIYMHVSEETTIDRLTKRRICSECGESYHEEYKRPQSEGRCDSCEAPLVQREDDEAEIIRKRMEIYEERTVPVIDHYRDCLDIISIDAERPHDVVWEELSMALEPYLPN